MIEAAIAFLRRLFGTAGGTRYKIGNRVYYQRPLVLGQIEQLVELINPATFAVTQGTTAVGIVRLLGDKLADVLAIVLTPRGVAVEEKDRAEIAAHLRNHVDIATARKVVADFFTCNPINSVFDGLTGALNRILPVPDPRSPVPGFKSSSVSSPAATSPSGDPSSGGAPSPSASPTSDTAAAS